MNAGAKPAPSATEPLFSLGRFESVCYARQHEAAAREFVALLGMLDRSFFVQPTASMAGMDQDPHIIIRICSALFSDPALNDSLPCAQGRGLGFARLRNSANQVQARERAFFHASLLSLRCGANFFRTTVGFR